MERLETTARDNSSLQSNGVVQAIKAVCTLMGMVETPDITEVVDKLVSNCNYSDVSIPLPSYKVARSLYRKESDP